MELVIGELVGVCMKKKIKNNKKNSDEPIGHLTRIDDTLPSPEELFIPDEKVKITIALDRETLAFFKSRSKKNGVKYQKMIREILKKYAEKYSA